MKFNDIVSGIVSKLRRDGLVKTVFAIIHYKVFSNQEHKYNRMQGGS